MKEERTDTLGFLKLSESLPFSLAVRPWGKSRIWIYCLSWVEIPALTPYKAEKNTHWLKEFTRSLLTFLDFTQHLCFRVEKISFQGQEALTGSSWSPALLIGGVRTQQPATLLAPTLGTKHCRCAKPQSELRGAGSFTGSLQADLALPRQGKQKWQHIYFNRN